ncbi:MAG: hypothetical protein NZ518_04275 [Dehalococcoidia bacterium]|nr:hypothetical protein [Dehalococcoidia bacterium]
MTPQTIFPPASAFILCFLPLIGVISGFVIFAFFTDREARSTYPRYNPYTVDHESFGDAAKEA